MKQVVSILMQLAVLLGAASCTYRDNKMPKRPMGSGQIGFADVNEQIFKQNCLICHGGTHEPMLNSYGAIKANLEKIQDDVIVKHSMPKHAPLSDDDIAFLQSWI